MTDKGPTLNYEYLETHPQHKKNKKYTDKDIQVVLTYNTRIQQKTMSKSQCLKQLEIDHGLKLGSTTLNKILNHTY